MTSQRILAGILLASVGAFGCQHAEDGTDHRRGGKTDDGDQVAGVVIDADDDGRTIEVHEGVPVIVELAADATTGYEWMVIATDRTFGAPAETEYVADGGAVGSGGMTRMTWVTDGVRSMVGDHTVTLEYRRPDEDPEVAAADRFRFTVRIVQDAGAADCRPLACQLACEHGFATDDDGCEICSCSEARRCGGLAGRTCAAGELCDYAREDFCGLTDALGTCRRTPDACLQVYDPVCGCDGQSYGNECEANASGVAVQRDGACE